MSMPLKLTIHPPLSRFTRELVDDNIEQGRGAFFGINAEMHAPGLLAMHAKRLTEAELAAEYWAPIFIHFPDPTVWDRDYAGTSAEMSRRSATLHRFATNPHYFEAAA